MASLYEADEHDQLCIVQTAHRVAGLHTGPFAEVLDIRSGSGQYRERVTAATVETAIVPRHHAS